MDLDSLDINEMFPKFTKQYDTKVLESPPNAMIKNISLDLEKIDIQKFQQKLDTFKAQLDKYKEIDNITNLPNDTRRVPFQEPYWAWYMAQRHVVKTKCLDMMLQLIYMARHKVKQLENERYFNRHDTSYRIAFLYRRMRKIWKKMLDIYTTMKKKVEKNAWGLWTYPAVHLHLHHRAAVLHVDFLYMWWVVVNLHHAYNRGRLIPNTTPNYNPFGNWQLPKGIL